MASTEAVDVVAGVVLISDVESSVASRLCNLSILCLSVVSVVDSLRTLD